jgi:hypothetical protein
LRTTQSLLGFAIWFSKTERPVRINLSHLLQLLFVYCLLRLVQLPIARLVFPAVFLTGFVGRPFGWGRSL